MLDNRSLKSIITIVEFEHASPDINLTYKLPELEGRLDNQILKTMVTMVEFEHVSPNINVFQFVLSFHFLCSASVSSQMLHMNLLPHVISVPQGFPNYQ